jgi:hypothetical protein
MTAISPPKHTSGEFEVNDGFTTSAHYQKLEKQN